MTIKEDQLFRLWFCIINDNGLQISFDLESSTAHLMEELLYPIEVGADGLRQWYTRAQIVQTFEVIQRIKRWMDYNIRQENKDSSSS
jgi:hypothetical protein